MQAEPLQIVWFKRDLRVADHAPLTLAARTGPVLPLYVIEPDLWRQSDASGRQLAFLLESLAELDRELRRLGQPLWLRFGAMPEVLAELHATHRIDGLWAHEETGNGWTFARDIAVRGWCRDQSIPFTELRQTGVHRALRSRDGWAARWEQEMRGALLPPPALPPLPAPVTREALPGLRDLETRMRLAIDPCEGWQPGGRRAGLVCLDSFLTRRGRTYRRAMSTPLEAFDACSRISPHLAFGTLSLREVTQAARTREAAARAAGDRDWSEAMTSFSGRLHWHCHFIQKLEDQPDLETRCLHPALEGLRPRDADAQRLAAWCNGETGLPFVDACMRALRATGWMNFRMRAMLMAVASYHLWLDWRATGAHLARMFTDYEPGIHWPQVQMQSGTTGINTIRIYNPVKQGLDQDPQGLLIRRFVPELAAIPTPFLHEPWRAPNAARVLDRVYPAPIVDHLAAAREARQTLWALRGARGFHDTADRIQARHGSRRAGLPMTGQDKRGEGTRRRGRAASLPDQLDLFGTGETSRQSERAGS